MSNQYDKNVNSSGSQSSAGQNGAGGQSAAGQNSAGGQSAAGQNGAGGQSSAGQSGTSGQSAAGQSGTGGQSSAGQSSGGKQSDKGGKKKGNQTEELLSRVYHDAAMGAKAIKILGEKVEDKQFYNELNRQKQAYNKIADQAEKELENIGFITTTTNPFSDMPLWGGIQINTIFNSTTGHLAKMVVDGNTMGISQMQEAVDENAQAAEKAREIARQFIDVQTENITGIKNYL